jgi:hypothetical protein
VAGGCCRVVGRAAPDDRSRSEDFSEEQNSFTAADPKTDQVADQEGQDIWVWDLARQTFSWLTFEAGNIFPV